MKKLLFILLVVGSIPLYAFRGGEFGVYSEYNHLASMFVTPSNWISYGLQMKLITKKGLTFDYRVSLSFYNRETNSFLFHTSAGSWMGASALNRKKYAGALLFILPDGIGFYTNKGRDGLHIGFDFFGSETEFDSGARIKASLLNTALVVSDKIQVHSAQLK